ncbi:hypothetical protein GWI33_023023 [Rhynchophorus ferrugineus]|uniref:Cationic amino acid transporter n=1 Tax=Rhynchophorus ferrugineus TaxID=354439 RepID=A0A834IRR6_RHYFE|nr:hypothetical protein GWI33_023023 [Rhynchophorus ferrugineus]
MNSLQNFAPGLSHWSFGVTVLIGLVSSEFTGAETLLAIFIAGCSATLSAICSCTISTNDDQYKRRRCSNLVSFLIIWLDILMNLVAASTCARLASATVDYISKGHFREFLFGLEQHSLGEPWPDVLGVTIILVVTVLFMVGLERSSTMSFLLFLVLVCNFAFFAIIGSFHTINKFQSWLNSFKIHSSRTVLKASAICYYAFIHKMSLSSKNNCLKIFTIFINPILFYSVIAIIFSLMTRYRELIGTAIPLIQVFENRDVDWARPLIAVFTICVVCLLLPEILPSVFVAFVRLASKEWRVFVSSIQYQSPVTGAPVLAIFATGSLAAILAFACPLSHLIKLLNASCLLKCVLTSCQILYTRYKPDITYNEVQVSTSNIQYSKLSQSTSRSSTKSNRTNIKDRLKSLFSKKPQYIHKLSSPKTAVCNVRKINHTRADQEEHECLLFDDYATKSTNVDIADDSNSENEENEMEILSCSEEENSDSSTDIDVIVEEYKEGLRVSTVGKFNERKPSTRTTSIIVIMCIILIISASISISLYIFRIIRFCWPDILAIIGSALVIMGLPENSAEKSKPCLLPSWLIPLFHSASISVNTVLSATILGAVWQGVVFWTLAGLLLYWRCDCCSCEILEPLVARTTAKIEPQTVFYEYKDTLPENIIIAR